MGDNRERQTLEDLPVNQNEDLDKAHAYYVEVLQSGLEKTRKENEGKTESEILANFCIGNFAAMVINFMGVSENIRHICEQLPLRKPKYDARNSDFN